MLNQPGWVTEIDGQARIQGGHVDIGADESDGTVWPDGPYTIVRVAPDGDRPALELDLPFSAIGSGYEE